MIMIKIAPAGREKYHTTILETGEYLGNFKTPLLAAARELVCRGEDPEQIAAITWDGVTPSLSGRLGVLAALTVIENEKQGPAFGKYKPFPSEKAAPSTPREMPLHVMR